MRVRSRATAVVTMVALAAVGTGPAYADGTRTLTGPATGDAEVFMTYVGCDSLDGPTAAPGSRINLGPYSAPVGRRSLGLVPGGPGTASGPFAAFGSLAGVDASVSVAATGGTRGVSYVMAVTPDSPPGTAWSGRADLDVAAGSWSSVAASSLTYDWTLVDLTTRAPLAQEGRATTGELAARHGDGPGFVVTGFGCDGRAFNLDAVKASGSTLDFEGTTLTTTVGVDRDQVPAGESVTVTGRVTEAGGRATGDTLVLESRRPGGAWTPVGEPVPSGPDGQARVDVPLTETTELRWHRPQSQYADEGWSEPVTVTVAQPAAPTDGAKQ